MPVVKIKTVDSKQGWVNPNNPEMVSYDVTIDVDGRKAEARTYSSPIAQVGFEGEVETYEKNDHTYLRQVKKEPWVKSGFQRKTYGGSPSKDNSDGQRQGMCINNASNYVNSQSKDYTPVQWAERVWRYANALYSLGDLHKPSPSEGLIKATQPEDTTPDEDQLDLSEINKIFGDK